MRGVETDHVISGLMNCLKKTHGERTSHVKTHRHCNSMTDTAQQVQSVKSYLGDRQALGCIVHCQPSKRPGNTTDNQKKMSTGKYT